MRKKLSLLLLISIIVSSILFISKGIKIKADECNDCNPIPTPPGDADYSQINCDCTGNALTIYASSSYISPEGSITLNLDSNGGGCTPYHWSVEGANYFIDKNITYSDSEEVTLTAGPGTCGDDYDNDNVIAIVRVTDKCGDSGQTDEIVIKNTEGKWSSSGAEQSCPFETPVRADSFYNVGGGWGAYAVDGQYKVTMVFHDPNNCNALGGCGPGGCCYTYLTEEQLDPLPCILTSHTYVSVDPCECTYNWVSSGECVLPMSIVVEKWACQ